MNLAFPWGRGSPGGRSDADKTMLVVADCPVLPGLISASVGLRRLPKGSNSRSPALPGRPPDGRRDGAGALRPRATQTLADSLPDQDDADAPRGGKAPRGRPPPEVDGIKTGFYRKAGHNIVATASRRGVRLIAVVLGGRSSALRFSQAARLLSLGFNGYERVVVIRQGAPVEGTVEVIEGKKGAIQPVAARDGVLFVPKGQAKKIKTTFVPVAPSLRAPVPQRKRLGKVQISLDGQLKTEVAAIAAEEIPRASLLWRLLMRLWRFLKGLQERSMGSPGKVQ